jgi:glycosyltransferase involved in cell wall biosynthesis
MVAAVSVRHIAYFSPLPPERSGISDYSAELLPHLAELADVTLFTAHPGLVAGMPCGQYRVHAVDEFPGLRWNYDIALYQIGNSGFHREIYAMLRRYPGVTVLHEYVLHHLVFDCTLGLGDFAGYIREMGYATGASGAELGRQVCQGQQAPPLFDVPLNDRTLDCSLGVIVHSRFVQARILQERPTLPTVTVPSPIQRPPEQLLSRRSLGCPEGALVFASAGRITSAKQICPALQAFARLSQEFPEAIYVLVGDEPEPVVGLETALQTLGLEGRVRCTGFIPDLEHFVAWIAAADVLLNLRQPTAGETSATALRGLAAGKPVIVTQDGWYDELPSDVCVKIPPGEPEALLSAMHRMAFSAQEREAIGRRAAAYAAKEHDPARAAEAYIRFIDRILAR